ncbi:hypothetical protein A3Q56_02394, partial [Intoshia linei]
SLGCHTDVTQILSNLCSARQDCQIQFQTKTFRDIQKNTNSCPKDLKLYLYIKYTCTEGNNDTFMYSVVKKNLVIDACKIESYSQQFKHFPILDTKDVNNTSEQPKLPRLVSSEENVDNACFHNIKTNTGRVLQIIAQQYNHNYKDQFLFSNTNSNSGDYSQHCKTLLIIQDASETLNLCLPTKTFSQKWPVYTTLSNSIRVGIQRKVGCGAINNDTNRWYKRKNDILFVGCQIGDGNVQSLYCYRNQWKGALPNCTHKKGFFASITETGDLSQQISIAIIISVALIVSTIIFVIGVVCIKRYSINNIKMMKNSRSCGQFFDRNCINSNMHRKSSFNHSEENEFQNNINKENISTYHCNMHCKNPKKSNQTDHVYSSIEDFYDLNMRYNPSKQTIDRYTSEPDANICNQKHGHVTPNETNIPLPPPLPPIFEVSHTK